MILRPWQYSAFNSSDQNRKYVEDPFRSGNSADKKAWQSCYETAGLVISDAIPDPSSGADHYHDDSAPKQSWMKPEYFKKKIGPFSFYDVP